jgi:hypothetical protein
VYCARSAPSTSTDVQQVLKLGRSLLGGHFTNLGGFQSFRAVGVTGGARFKPMWLRAGRGIYMAAIPLPPIDINLDVSGVRAAVKLRKLG